MFADQSISLLDLAEKACHIEIERVGSPIGKQDQYACALGGINRLEFMANGTVIATRVPNGLKIMQSVSKSSVSCGPALAVMLIPYWRFRTRETN